MSIGMWTSLSPTSNRSAPSHFLPTGLQVYGSVEADFWKAIPHLCFLYNGRVQQTEVLSFLVLLTQAIPGDLTSFF